MKKQLFKIIALCALTAFGMTTSFPAQAQDKPAASTEAKKDRTIPFKGKINEIDKAAKTIGIGKEKKRTFHITDSTKITKDGKTVMLSDATVGDEVGGTYRDNGGKLEAVSLRIGPKPEGEAKTPGRKKKE